MKSVVGFFEKLLGDSPKRNAALLGLSVGTVGVILATYALMRIKGMDGRLLDGIKIGAGCPICRAFWTGVGTAVIGTVWVTYLFIRDGENT